MNKLQRIEDEVQGLSPEELADFRRWFASYDAALWDHQFVRDVEGHKLDALRAEALDEHESQRTSEL
jgi:hypothetical protein